MKTILIIDFTYLGLGDRKVKMFAQLLSSHRTKPWSSINFSACMARSGDAHSLAISPTNYKLALFAIRPSSRKVKDKDQKRQPVAYIASTIRNSETYERFLNTLGECKTNVEAELLQIAAIAFVSIT